MSFYECLSMNFFLHQSIGHDPTQMVYCVTECPSDSDGVLDNPHSCTTCLCVHCNIFGANQQYGSAPLMTALISIVMGFSHFFNPGFRWSWVVLFNCP